MNEEDVAKTLERLIQNRSRDSRLTALHTWFTVTVGTVGIGIAAWGVNSINQLTQAMAVQSERFENERQRAQRIETHIEKVDTRVVILERKVR